MTARHQEDEFFRGAVEASPTASVVDITERKRSEAELRRSNEELEQFVYVASHDLPGMADGS